ncbi:crotonobetainyl-CoA:carnitine CoA-transferase CaiB-like acyl-CoA transferase [Shimia isoporae]|uniref:Crotonobetainyl-CoA:carnitine CoA-transferase CaiB-like acyl-CoA transferase n=1 Tax=Shimia isoporae TaxID=647720 RepID=A0A4R1NKD2_9RHOB|nr:CaiB/BaiF CoA-transferase family protein [Shimia isoporae]TCL08091.1 crotonobetainyl-CoA:carnitine CoA-transferase CaiB-like acyl-CoA transferase [Shimia isoporae]
MLNGIRIIEIEGLGPGPFAAMHLADLGADVITIHRKGGGGITADQSVLDRGKRSIALDLKDPDDLATAKKLISTADALIEGFRPGVMERLGLGPEALHAENPKLVYGRMTGWGQSGPRAQTAGHDLNYIAQSGALWYASEPGSPPMTPATLVGDIGGGALYLVIGILSGILNAQRTGQGTVVDAAIIDGSAHMMNLLMALKQAGGLATDRGMSLLDGPHWSRSYACADGGYVSVQCLEPQFYSAFLAKLDLSEDPEFSRQHDKALWPKLTTRLADLFLAHPRDHWDALFADSDACVAVVLSPKEAAIAPHTAERGIWQAPDGHLQAAAAPRFDGRASDLKRAPARGQHTDEILGELG